MALKFELTSLPQDLSTGAAPLFKQLSVGATPPVLDQQFAVSIRGSADGVTGGIRIQTGVSRIIAFTDVGATVQLGFLSQDATQIHLGANMSGGLLLSTNSQPLTLGVGVNGAITGLQVSGAGAVTIPNGPLTVSGVVTGTLFEGSLPYLPTATSTLYDNTVLALSPLVYMKFAEASGAVAADSSGNGLNGAYVGSVTYGQPSLIASNVSTSVAFPGTVNDYATWNTSITLNPRLASMSWECWFKTTASGTEDIMRRDTGASVNGYELRINSSGAGIVDVVLNNAIDAQAGSLVLNDGNPHHIVVVLNRSTDRYQIYADGSLAGDSDASSQHSVDIGGTNLIAGQIGRSSVVTLARLAVYGAALTAAQVLANYNAGKSPLSPSQVGWWRVRDYLGADAYLQVYR